MEHREGVRKQKRGMSVKLIGTWFEEERWLNESSSDSFHWPGFIFFHFHTLVKRGTTIHVFPCLQPLTWSESRKSGWSLSLFYSTLWATLVYKSLLCFSVSTFKFFPRMCKEENSSPTCMNIGKRKVWAAKGGGKGPSGPVWKCLFHGDKLLSQKA